MINRLHTQNYPKDGRSQRQTRLVRSLILVGLFIGMVGLLRGHAADELHVNLAAIRIMHAIAAQPPFRWDSIQSSGSSTVTDPLVSAQLARIQETYAIDADERGALALAGAYLANGEPVQAERLLQPNNDLLARTMSAIACYWQSGSNCALRDAEVTKTLRESGFNLWQTQHPAAGFFQLLLAEHLDESTASQDTAIIYAVLSAGANAILGDRQQAVRWAQNRVTADPNDRDAYLDLAALYLSTGQPEMASRTLQDAKPLGIQSVWRFYSLMGRIAAALDDRDGALRYYYQAYELAPLEITNAWYLGSMLAATGRKEEACSFLMAVAQTESTQEYDKYLAQMATQLLDQIGTCDRS